MNDQELAAINIEDLIPHRGKMILIDKIITIEKEYAVTSSIVGKSWPLVTDAGVKSLILVELAAQCAGVCNGWDRIQTLGMDSNKMGWLVGVKRANFTVGLIPFNSEIISRAENTSKYDALREIQSVLKLNDEIIGEVTLQLFQA
jgi:predicted hotdog family 3-hydroxylacyl-ACP dehydratase